MADPEFDDAARRSDDPPPPGVAFAADSGAPASGEDHRDTVQFDAGDLAGARRSGPDFAEHDDAPAHPGAGPDFSAARPAGPDVSAARAATAPDFVVPPSSAARDFDSSPAAFADQAGAAPAGDLSADEPGGPGRRDANPDDPDYERASAAINSARSEIPNEDAWRRDPTTGSPAAASPSASPDASSAASPAAFRADEPVEAEEFAEPDADDPDDEPLPQAVRPADAVGVARLEAEVMVVDGRPRYHLPECPSLIGRLAEPIPVREAVELGFSPCGLCRPVDRLVGAAARR
nr:hypothetical protein [Actinoplanes solisilvae]